MISFTFKDNRLQIDHIFMMVPEFVAIWKSDKKDRKPKANQILLYLYLMSDLSDECPTKNLDQATKDSQCRFMAFGAKDREFSEQEWKLINPGLDAYVLLNQTSEERLFPIYDEKIDQLRDVLKDTTPQIIENVNDKTGVTSFTTNVAIINAALKEIANLVKAKQDLRQAVLAGYSSGHVRGQVRLSPRDKKKLTLRK